MFHPLLRLSTPEPVHNPVEKNCITMYLSTGNRPFAKLSTFAVHQKYRVMHRISKFASSCSIRKKCCYPQKTANIYYYYYVFIKILKNNKGKVKTVLQAAFSPSKRTQKTVFQKKQNRHKALVQPGSAFAFLRLCCFLAEAVLQLMPHKPRQPQKHTRAQRPETCQGLLGMMRSLSLPSRPVHASCAPSTFAPGCASAAGGQGVCPVFPCLGAHNDACAFSCTS